MSDMEAWLDEQVRASRLILVRAHTRSAIERGMHAEYSCQALEMNDDGELFLGIKGVTAGSFGGGVHCVRLEKPVAAPPPIS